MKFPFQKFLKEIAQDLQKRQVKIEGIYFPSTQNKDEEFCCTVAAEMTNLTYPVSSQVKEYLFLATGKAFSIHKLQTHSDDAQYKITSPEEPELSFVIRFLNCHSMDLNKEIDVTSLCSEAETPLDAKEWPELPKSEGQASPLAADQVPFSTSIKSPSLPSPQRTLFSPITSLEHFLKIRMNFPDGTILQIQDWSRLHEEVEDVSVIVIWITQYYPSELNPLMKGIPSELRTFALNKVLIKLLKADTSTRFSNLYPWIQKLPVQSTVKNDFSEIHEKLLVHQPPLIEEAFQMQEMLRKVFPDPYLYVTSALQLFLDRCAEVGKFEKIAPFMIKEYLQHLSSDLIENYGSYLTQQNLKKANALLLDLLGHLSSTSYAKLVSALLVKNHPDSHFEAVFETFKLHIFPHFVISPQIKDSWVSLLKEAKTPQYKELIDSFKEAIGRDKHKILSAMALSTLAFFYPKELGIAKELFEAGKELYQWSIKAYPLLAEIQSDPFDHRDSLASKKPQKAPSAKPGKTSAPPPLPKSSQDLFKELQAWPIHIAKEGKPENIDSLKDASLTLLKTVDPFFNFHQFSIVFKLIIARLESKKKFGQEELIEFQRLAVSVATEQAKKSNDRTKILLLSNLTNSPIDRALLDSLTEEELKQIHQNLPLESKSPPPQIALWSPILENLIKKREVALLCSFTKELDVGSFSPHVQRLLEELYPLIINLICQNSSSLDDERTLYLRFVNINSFGAKEQELLDIFFNDLLLSIWRREFEGEAKKPILLSHLKKLVNFYERGDCLPIIFTEYIVEYFKTDVADSYRKANLSINILNQMYEQYELWTPKFIRSPIVPILICICHQTLVYLEDYLKKDLTSVHVPRDICDLKILRTAILEKFCEAGGAESFSFSFLDSQKNIIDLLEKITQACLEMNSEISYEKINSFVHELSRKAALYKSNTFITLIAQRKSPLLFPLFSCLIAEHQGPLPPQWLSDFSFLLDKCLSEEVIPHQGALLNSSCKWILGALEKGSNKTNIKQLLMGLLTFGGNIQNIWQTWGYFQLVLQNGKNLFLTHFEPIKKQLEVLEIWTEEMEEGYVLATHPDIRKIEQWLSHQEIRDLEIGEFFLALSRSIQPDKIEGLREPVQKVRGILLDYAENLLGDPTFSADHPLASFPIIKFLLLFKEALDLEKREDLISFSLKFIHTRGKKLLNLGNLCDMWDFLLTYRDANTPQGIRTIIAQLPSFLWHSEIVFGIVPEKLAKLIEDSLSLYEDLYPEDGVELPILQFILNLAAVDQYSRPEQLKMYAQKPLLIDVCQKVANALQNGSQFLDLEFKKVALPALFRMLAKIHFLETDIALVTIAQEGKGSSLISHQLLEVGARLAKACQTQDPKMNLAELLDDADFPPILLFHLNQIRFSRMLAKQLLLDHEVTHPLVQSLFRQVNMDLILKIPRFSAGFLNSSYLNNALELSPVIVAVQMQVLDYDRKTFSVFITAGESLTSLFVQRMKAPTPTPSDLELFSIVCEALIPKEIVLKVENPETFKENYFAALKPWLVLIEKDPLSSALAQAKAKLGPLWPKAKVNRFTKN